MKDQRKQLFPAGSTLCILFSHTHILTRCKGLSLLGFLIVLKSFIQNAEDFQTDLTSLVAGPRDKVINAHSVEPLYKL